MLKNLIVPFLFFGIALNSNAQETKNSWQIGLGASLVKYNKSDIAFFKEEHLFQLPRVSASIPITERFSLESAISFALFNDLGFIKNTANYFSADVSLRFHFKTEAVIYPYVFIGGSIVDAEYNATPTYNIGGGATYWFSDKWGVNTQVYYKYSESRFQSMRSHFQGAIGVVYNIADGTIFGGRRNSRGTCD